MIKEVGYLAGNLHTDLQECPGLAGNLSREGDNSSFFSGGTGFEKKEASTDVKF